MANKEKRTKRIKISLTNSEFEELNRKKNNQQLAVWIRETILNQQTENKNRRTFTKYAIADPKLLYELNKIGVNINQITKKLYSVDLDFDLMIALTFELSHIRETLTELLNRYDMQIFQETK